jgi:hypothetical protein
LVLFVLISVLQTANFQTDPENELLLLKKYQPDKPGMVMEYWSGWFDHWFEPQHHTTSVEGNGQYIMYAALISLESLSSVALFKHMKVIIIIIIIYVNFTYCYVWV